MQVHWKYLRSLAFDFLAAKKKNEKISNKIADQLNIYPALWLWLVLHAWEHESTFEALSLLFFSPPPLFLPPEGSITRVLYILALRDSRLSGWKGLLYWPSQLKFPLRR